MTQEIKKSADEYVRLADYVFDFLARQGVKHVFLLPGGGAMHLVDAVGQASGITFVPCHHEQAAGIAAEAYGRISGKPGVVLVTTGPGGTNVLTPVVGAWIESIPLIVISGQVKRADRIGNTGVRQVGVQEVDVVRLASSVTKYAVTVEDPQSIRLYMEQAFALATTGRQGPVWLDIPLDVQASRIDPDQLPGWRPLPPEENGQEMAERAAVATVAMLNRCQRPLFLVGHGVRLAGAAEIFRKVYESCGIPVATTWNAMDLIPYSHPLSAGKPGSVALRGANFIVQNCDLLIAVGARLDLVVTAYNPQYFARGAKKVVVDIDPHEFGKLAAMPEAQTFQADAHHFLAALLQQSSGRVFPDWQPWRERCLDWKMRYPVLDGHSFPSQGIISHYHLAEVLSEEIAEDTLIATGSSGLGVEAFYAAFRNKEGQRLMLTAGLGSMGYGLPAAIGACLAAGEGRPIVAVESDGSLQLNLQELSTLRQWQLPICLFILNNGGYASIRNTQRTYFNGRYVATGPEAGLFLPDLLAVAQAMGIETMQIGDAADLVDGVRQALRHPGPLLCDVQLQADEVLWPKVAAIPQPDGSMLSMPLEDMSPLLPLAELQKNMMIPLLPASEKARVS